MKHLWGVMKKDLDKVFKNPRMIFSTIILPGLLLFLIYSFMGTSFANFIDSTEENLQTRTSTIIIHNAPTSFNEFASNEVLNELNIKFIIKDDFDLEKYKDEVLHEEIDGIIVFENDFDNKLGKTEPEINMIYNPTSSFSSNSFSKLQYLLNLYKDHTLNELLADQGLSANLFKPTPTEVFSEKKSGGMILASLLPMLIITFIFSGCLASGTDAIAGEKERGTLQTLLMAPVKRNNIIGGKIISTTILAVSSAISSFIGIMASMPFAKELFLPGDVTLSYEALDYIGLFLIFLVVAFIASSTILIASTFGKNIKEATSYAMPLFIVAMLVSVISMFDSSLPQGIIPYLIPIYNATLGLKGILLFQLKIYQFLMIIGSSLVFISLITFLLVKLFKNEKVLFSK
ncbi:MAG TPA: ABC transporter permease [Acholeplasmataceae bacterium]|nr:ABC transporter permease [Acholeplasmataceae bacterium]